MWMFNLWFGGNVIGHTLHLFRTFRLFSARNQLYDPLPFTHSNLRTLWCLQMWMFNLRFGGNVIGHTLHLFRTFRLFSARNQLYDPLPFTHSNLRTLWCLQMWMFNLRFGGNVIRHTLHLASLHHRHENKSYSEHSNIQTFFTSEPALWPIAIYPFKFENFANSRCIIFG